MLTKTEEKALHSLHAPNLYITILSAVAMIVAGLGLHAAAATLISFGIMIASLVWSNAKISTTLHAAVHSGNFWTVVLTVLAYLASRLFGVTLPSGVIPAVAAVVTMFVVGNTVRQAPAKATSTAAAGGSTGAASAAPSSTASASAAVASTTTASTASASGTTTAGTEG